MNLSVALVLEYEEVCKRLVESRDIALTKSDIDDILDYLCQVASHTSISYLWRPFLADPDDDMVLELAVAAQCKTIVTFNKSDFRGVEQFGIRARTPNEFLRDIGDVS